MTSVGFVLMSYVFFFFFLSVGRCQLQTGFYASSCPNAESIVKSEVSKATQQDSRLPASLIRLHFHDCFVQGCDASVLLDDTSSFTGEKTAGPNNNSLRGFEVIDTIKTSLESSCKGVVSCADILAIAARDSSVITGGPSWDVRLGRRDSTTASLSGANSQIPSPAFTVNQLISAFTAKGLSAEDMFTLSGAHTIGQAKCSSFSGRLFNNSGSGQPDPSIRQGFLKSLQSACPQGGDATALQPLDVATATTFDNQYYSNLLLGRGLLNSDQVLSTTVGTARNFVKAYSSDQSKFFSNFAGSMINMGNISPLTTPNGIIRSNCRVPS
ncbi:peroxidase A2 isoform X2 [Selaginella moellendorffii]|uniref:peroxidase A2 isoform X2 n=1 Tax=Selaginella moellendorffii TaxID=88036 RepID=UPI000D1C5093|nr:peroxidase A2 isoform X2 [Selaginella moellendorffii]|eukprot:XP_024518323.1 peroxidase A2 isoform X2 [Selaginella moellendorffii]